MIRGWLRKKENRAKVKQFLHKSGAKTIKITKKGVVGTYKVSRAGYVGTKKVAIGSKKTYKKAQKEFRDWEEILGETKRRKRVTRRPKRKRKFRMVREYY